MSSLLRLSEGWCKLMSSAEARAARGCPGCQESACSGPSQPSPHLRTARGVACGHLLPEGVVAAVGPGVGEVPQRL
jgi:hypothetical protein